MVRLIKFLGLFTDEHKKSQQEAHLQGVIIEFTKFGYVLFSQPEDIQIFYDFGQGSDEIVTHPGLVKTRDENGVLYKPPRYIIYPVTERV